MWLRIMRRALQPLAIRMKGKRPAAEEPAAKPEASRDRFEKKRGLVH
jgi:hypothetical protein